MTTTTKTIPANVATLAGLFTQCISCFEYVQLGRNFGPKFQQSMLKLDLIRLRLSRWGESMGFHGRSGIKIDTLLPPLVNRELELAQMKLNEIISIFAEMEKRSRTFARTATKEDLAVYNPSNMDAGDRYAYSMRSTLRNLAERRQPPQSLANRAAWALYDERYFNELLRDVTIHVNDLIQLFPATQDSQQMMCVAEVAEIRKTNNQHGMQLLQEAVGDLDPVLKAKVGKALETLTGHIFRNLVISDDSVAHLGDTFSDPTFSLINKSPHTYENTQVKDRAIVHMGNSYGGASILTKYLH